MIILFLVRVPSDTDGNAQAANSGYGYSRKIPPLFKGI